MFIRGVSIGFLKTRSAMDEYNLPESYGKTRLVVLAVDPYLIHAYWEIAPPELDEASRHAGKSKAVLRFTKGTNQDEHADWFDVDIDLQSRNWYVHLWSAEESYRVDLGLKRSDGTLIRLVPSQLVLMPRSLPAPEIDQRPTRVDPTERRAETVPVPSPQQDPQQETIPLSNLPEPDARLVPPLPIDSAKITREQIKTAYASRNRVIWHSCFTRICRLFVKSRMTIRSNSTGSLKLLRKLTFPFCSFSII
ncbi:MAG: hypothetical protein DMG20_08430 [Acidobacteria bacterium]|nr:MAG: hypothetical protein DMG20_08430 [Acidobacteriota bacterium]